MAKKTTQPIFDYANFANHPTLISMFSKVKPSITLEEAIEAHKTLFSDITKPAIEEDILKYFNK
jgi:hypothetical protein